MPAASDEAPVPGLTSVARVAMIEQISGWLVLMILTGIMTAKLLGVIDPFIPVADWHALARHIFVIVIWSSMTWSLRRFASLSLLDLFPAFWW
jgi:hypothetical protein